MLWSNNVNLETYKLSSLPYPFPGNNAILQTTNNIFNALDFKYGKYDLYHATYFNNFFNRLTDSQPFITTFYDMIYERLSYRFKDLSNDTEIIKQKKIIAQKASHLIAISHSTKCDMVELLGIDPERITVIHLASSFDSNSVHALSRYNAVEKPYILYVGNRNGYKNFSNFLVASAPLLKKYRIFIICAGGGKFNKEEHKLIGSLSINEYVEQLAITDTVLPNLYREATAFVFPSFYEGFGIPVLEAFTFDCPCIVGNNSAFPEVAGDAALYVDPADPESIAYAIEQIITDTDLRADLIRRGKQRLALFSWRTTVTQTLDVYAKLI